jgi:hypothetical protein
VASRHTHAHAHTKVHTRTHTHTRLHIQRMRGGGRERERERECVCVCVCKRDSLAKAVGHKNRCLYWCSSAINSEKIDRNPELPFPVKKASVNVVESLEIWFSYLFFIIFVTLFALNTKHNWRLKVTNGQLNYLQRIFDSSISKYTGRFFGCLQSNLSK